jgi:putative transposase
MTGIDPLRVADLTSIRLPTEFVYPAVLLDAFSRRAIGWGPGRTLEASLTLAALRRALGRRTVKPGLTRHSDRGVQYACRSYVEHLESHGIALRMSRKGDPYDNAKAESGMQSFPVADRLQEMFDGGAGFFKGFIAGQADLFTFQSFPEALGYRPPTEFEELFLRSDEISPESPLAPTYPPGLLVPP